MQEVSHRLRRVEDRLERLLASGWRNAGAEAAELIPEADALAALGLVELSGQLRKVAAAGGAMEALRAIAMTSASCRMMRARIPADSMPPGAWTPLAGAQSKKGPAATRLLPVARMALTSGEAWVGVRVRGIVSGEWVLLDPLWREIGPAEPPRPPAGVMSRLLRFGKGKEEPPVKGEAPIDETTPWLCRQVQGHLRWRARYLLGAAGEVQHCSLAEASWPEPPDAEHDPLTHFRQALADGKLQDGLLVLRGGGPLRVKELEGDAAADYVWPDQAAALAFQSVARGKVWALAWVQGPLIAPLAVIVPGGLLRKPQLVHLVPGAPSEALPF